MVECWTPCCVRKAHCLLVWWGFIQLNSKRLNWHGKHMFIIPKQVWNINPKKVRSISKDLFYFNTHCCWLGNTSDTLTEWEKTYPEGCFTLFWSNMTLNLKTVTKGCSAVSDLRVPLLASVPMVTISDTCWPVARNQK